MPNFPVDVNSWGKSAISRGEFIRQAINGAVFKEIPVDNFTELIGAVKHTGSLLEQILRYCRENEDYRLALNEALKNNYETEQMLWDTFAPGGR